MYTDLSLTNTPFSDHITDLYKIIRKISIIFGAMCILWSILISDMMSIWINMLPISNGNIENLAIYGPYEWITLRWSLILLLSLVSILPILSLYLYSFSRIGLYPHERTWFIFVLILCTTVVPLIIIVLWIFGIPSIFEISDSNLHNESIGIRYDAAALFSVALGLTWILVIWSFTVIILGLSRLFGLVDGEDTRFRYRILAITIGLLILTIPSEYDGLRVIFAVLSILSADRISRTFPIFSSNKLVLFKTSN